MNSNLEQRSIAKDEKEALSLALTWWKSHSEALFVKNKSLSWALSGGKTPRALYESLARHDELPWKAIYLYQVDERNEPTSSDQSNLGMILHSGLGTRVLPGHLFGMREAPFEAMNPSSYTQKILHHCEGGVIDLVLLGMGSDGHTASLFPSTPLSLNALEFANPPLVAIYQVPELAGKWRQTLSLECLLRARHVLFYCLGQDKRAQLERVWYEKSCELPAALVSRGRLARGLPVAWIVDELAGA